MRLVLDDDLSLVVRKPDFTVTTKLICVFVFANEKKLVFL